MSFPHATRLNLWTTALVVGLISQCGAAPKLTQTTAGVVDVVDLKAGKSLRGGIAWQQADGKLVMLVSADWYREAFPAKFDAVLAENIDQARTALTEARDRITGQLKTVGDSQFLESFLKQELERIDQLLAARNPPEPQFLWIEVPTKTIAKVSRASPDSRMVALYSWDEHLTKVETRSAASLTKELNEKGIKINELVPDLSDRWPVRTQTEQEWSARMALVKYSLGKPLDFQGTGDTLVRTEAGQGANLAQILPRLLQQQLGSVLQDLTGESPQTGKPLGDTESLKVAIREAESANQTGFRVTKVAVDQASGRSTVETRFVTKIAAEQWQTVWQATVIEDGNKSRPEAEARIEQDPQLKTILDSLKPLGLFDGATIQQAIRMGAATMAAQQAADTAFFEFRDFYIRRLDGPPLQIKLGQSF